MVGTCEPEPTEPLEGQQDATAALGTDPQHVGAAAEDSTRENVWSDESIGAVRCIIRCFAS